MYQFLESKVYLGLYKPLYGWNTGNYFHFSYVSYDVLVLTVKKFSANEPV